MTWRPFLAAEEWLTFVSFLELLRSPGGGRKRERLAYSVFGREGSQRGTESPTDSQTDRIHRNRALGK